MLAGGVSGGQVMEDTAGDGPEGLGGAAAGSSPQTERTAGSVPASNIRIGDVRVRDFRNLEDVCLTLGHSTTVLVGENNSGKTSFLEALEVAIGARRAIEDDLLMSRDGARSARFIVDLVVVPTAARFENTVAPLFGNAIERSPDGGELVAIRAVGEPNPDGSGVSIRRAFLQGWSGCETVEAEPREMPQPRVGGRVLETLAFHLLDAKRDLVADLRSRRSPWGRLLANLDVPDDLRAEIEAELTGLGNRVVSDSGVLSRLTERLSAVTQTLGSSITSVELAPLPVRVEEVARAVDVHVTAPGGAALPLRRQGMGSRSLAALAVFRAFVDLRLGMGHGVRPLAITGFEEPEAHLHPQAQSAVARLIDEIPGQKVVSTHSPRVAHEAELESLRFFRRQGHRIRICQIRREYTHEQLVKVRRFVQRRLGEALFARLVVLGDGATERQALPVFGRAHWEGQDPEGLGVSVLEVPNLRDETAQTLIGVLEDLGIPWLVLVDADDAGRKAIASLGEHLGRDALAEAQEVVWLPEGQAFERHLVEEGPLDAIEAGIADVYGERALDEYASRRGWESLARKELVFRFLRHYKGSYGAGVAQAIVEARQAAGQDLLPGAIRQLFERADELLEGS